jgi:hypothetical protein
MRGNPVVFTGFEKGLNSRDAPYRVEDGEARDLLNVISTARGSVRKRNGSVQFAAEDAHSLFAGITTKVLIAGVGTKLRKVTTGGVGSDLKTGLTAGQHWEWIEGPASGGQGPFYGMNGLDTPQQWDGLAGSTSDWTAATGAVPNGKFIVQHANRVWVAGLASDPSALYWSNLGDPRDWPAENIERFDPNDGGAITGIGKAGPFLVVFKERKAWLVQDLDRGGNRPLSDSIGCVAPRSIVDTPRGTFFLSHAGIYRTDGHSLSKISGPVDPTIGLLIASERSKAAALFFDDHYYLSYARSGGDPDRTLDYDINLGSWWLHTLAARQWTAFEPTSGLEIMGALPARISRCFTPNTHDDAGVAFPGFWSSAFHAFGMPALRKRFRGVHFDGSGRIEFQVARDFSPLSAEAGATLATGDSTLFGVDDGSVYGGDDGTLFGGLATVESARAMSLGAAKALSVQFGNTSTDPFEVDSYTVFLTPRKD